MCAAEITESRKTIVRHFCLLLSFSGRSWPRGGNMSNLMHWGDKEDIFKIHDMKSLFPLYH